MWKILLLRVLLQEQFSTLFCYNHLQEDHESYLCSPSVPLSFFSIGTLLQNILLNLSSLSSYWCHLLWEGTCPSAMLCYSPLRNLSSQSSWSPQYTSCAELAEDRQLHPPAARDTGPAGGHMGWDPCMGTLRGNQTPSGHFLHSHVSLWLPHKTPGCALPTDTQHWSITEWCALALCIRQLWHTLNCCFQTKTKAVISEQTLSHPSHQNPLWLPQHSSW